MAWIESHTVLLRHRKVLLFASALGLKPVQAIGHLHALWHAVLEQQEDGDLSAWPDEMIAFSAAYEGDAVRFVYELQDKNWLDERIVHDWLDYAGRYLTVKYRTANPRKLKQIFTLHKSVYKSVSSRSKVRLKTDNLTNLTVPNQPNRERKQKSPTHAMPEDWSLTDGMRAYGLSKGMTPATIEHEFEHCREHHRKNESRFTEKGWASSVWNTWVLNWIKFGSKQIAGPATPPPQVKCCWLNGGGCEEYAKPGSKYCVPHGDVVKKAQERVSASATSAIEDFQTVKLLAVKVGRSM